MTEPILSLRGVNKSFGPVHVLKDVIADGFQTREAVCADIEELCTENGI